MCYLFFFPCLCSQELLKKSQRCMEVIIDAKERQAAEANKNATILLQEIDQEKVSARYTCTQCWGNGNW